MYRIYLSEREFPLREKIWGNAESVDAYTTWIMCILLFVP